MPLIAPYRARVERLTCETRALLQELPEDEQCSMGFDAAMDALDTLQNLSLVARDLRHESWLAIVGRDGFDTWTERHRDAFVSRARALASKFDELSHAVRDKLEEEEREIARLRADLQSRSAYQCGR